MLHYTIKCFSSSVQYNTLQMFNSSYVPLKG